MKQTHIKPSVGLGLLVTLLFSAFFIAQASHTPEHEKAEWLGYAKELFDHKIPKGYDVILPPAIGGGGETYVSFSLVPKSSKDKSQQIKVGVFVAGFPTMEEYITSMKGVGLKDLGIVTIKRQQWYRYVPPEEDAKSYECHGAVKDDKMYEFCLDSGGKAPSAKLKKIYQMFLKSVKLK